MQASFRWNDGEGAVRAFRHFQDSITPDCLIPDCGGQAGIHHPVIPAQAGIQWLIQSIPAPAGMAICNHERQVLPCHLFNKQ